MTADVTIALTGPFALRRSGQRQSLRLAGPTKRLFMLLTAHYNRGLRRDRICDEIWPDLSPPRARAALNTGLWRIKNRLRECAGLAVSSIDDVVRLSVDDTVYIDADRLARAVTATTKLGPGTALPDRVRTTLEYTVTECRQEFLEGVSDHWVLPLRERFSSLFIEGLILLMRDAATCSNFERALMHGREIIDLDPFREGTQRDVMLLFMRNGQRVQALRQYDALSDLLACELGIEPMAETQELYACIRDALPVETLLAAMAERPLAAAPS